MQIHDTKDTYYGNEKIGHSTVNLAQDVLCPVGTGCWVCRLRMSTPSINFQQCTGGSIHCSKEKKSQHADWI